MRHDRLPYRNDAAIAHAAGLPRPVVDDWIAVARRTPRLWAALQQASGGTWGGCVYDPEAVAARLAGGGTAAIQPSSGSRSAGRP